MRLIGTLIWFFATTAAIAAGQQCNENVADPEGEWKFMDPYEPNINDTCYLQYDHERCNGLFLTVNHLDLNGTGGDHFVIVTSAPNSKITGGRVFIWNQDPEAEPRRYLVHGHKIQLIMKSGEDTEGFTGLDVRYSCNRDVETTPEPTTTEYNPYPDTNVTDSAYLNVYIRRVSAREFVNAKLDNFVAILKKMAVVYCESKDIQYDKDYPPEPEVDLVRQCSYTWPDFKRCVEVRFAIKVSVTKPEPSIRTGNNDTDYQLNSTNLKDMWDALSDDNLKELSLENYEKIDEEKEYFVWIIVPAITLLALCIYTLVLRNYGIRCAPGDRKRRKSDIQEFFDQDRPETDIPIGLHPTQTVPNIFEPNDDYRYYEPGNGMSANVADQWPNYNESNDYMSFKEESEEEDEEVILDLPTGHAYPSSVYRFDNPAFESET